MGGWAAASVARWLKFRPKSSKGAGEKKVGWKNLWLNFGQILQRRGQRNFWKEFPSWQNFFHVCTGQKIISGTGNAGSSILYTRQQLSAVRFVSQIRKDNLCLPF